jgi:LmbE family N-acetylglucosaminyl deacetylase
VRDEGVRRSAGTRACNISPRAKMAGMATIVAFRAHPDDEVLLTGGTLALLAAGGHRVVIVVACSGWMGRPDIGRRGDIPGKAA